MITGHFKNVSAPRQLAVGSKIQLGFGYYALNPGALYWKSVIIADSPTLGRMTLQVTREIGQEGGFNTRTFSLWNMRHDSVAITLSLWGHDDAGYDWNWADYDTYMLGMYGYQTGIVPLAWEYIFIDSVALVTAPKTGLDLKILKYEILGDAGSSIINFYPLALDAEGHYYKGEVVSLTAIPSSGYKFTKWRGEVDNPLSTSLTNTVTMSETRLVKAEFSKIPVSAPTPTPTPIPIPEPTPTPAPNWLPLVIIGGIALIALAPKGKK